MRKVPLFLVVALLPALASAQTVLYRYDAKYICGKQASPPHNFVPGVYFTSINVYSNKLVQFRKRFTVSLVDEKTGGTTGWIVTTLPAGQSLQIDCDNILAHLQAANVPPPGGQVTEGFVVIQTPGVKLDVVAFYSAGPQNGPVSSLLMERVPAAQ
ncbi:MAG TPA: hypothetical protein VGQ36_20480 [Thermoanaerobaculia bacterium]|jgi:hypothetical protein|nr:hypothetical protein [Thermoanaerobaculia bacterium]